MYTLNCVHRYTVLGRTDEETCIKKGKSMEFVSSISSDEKTWKYLDSCGGIVCPSTVLGIWVKESYRKGQVDNDF